jgi:hypothetical protein
MRHHTPSNPYRSPAWDGLNRLEYRPSEVPHAELLQRRFLYRKVRVSAPIDALVEYSGFSLHDRIWVNQQLVFCRLPLIWLTDSFEFELETDRGSILMQLRLHFHRFAQLKQFEILFDGNLIFQENADRQK